MADENEKLVTLNTIPLGKKCVVIGFKEMAKNKRRHLLDMGITRGCVIEIVKKAPFGDPVSIVIRGYDLCLRKTDMSNIIVEVQE